MALLKFELVFATIMDIQKQGHAAWLWNKLDNFLLWFDRARGLTASVDSRRTLHIVMDIVYET